MTATCIKRDHLSGSFLEVETTCQATSISFSLLTEKYNEKKYGYLVRRASIDATDRKMGI